MALHVDLNTNVSYNIILLSFKANLTSYKQVYGIIELATQAAIYLKLLLKVQKVGLDYRFGLLYNSEVRRSFRRTM